MAKILGIDVGGTGVKGAIVDTQTGELLTQRFKHLTPKNNNAKIILETIMKIVEDTGWNGKRIGCGFPAVMRKGVCYSASNIDKSFLGQDIVKYFNKNSNFKFNIINDADAAGLAEMKFGAGKGKNGTVVMLTLGTGIGSAIFYDGTLLPNSELGHLKFNNLIAEKYTSNKTREDLELDWEAWGIRLNEFLNHVAFVLSPELIILGGGVSKKYNRFGHFLEVKHCDLVPAILKNEAGSIGAALACEL
jgi:polyphosphate glucokinase